MQPEEAMFVWKAILSPTLTDEHHLTRRIVEAVPVDKADYRPNSVARTAFELARHIVATEKRFLVAVVSGEFDRGTVLPEGIQTPTDLAGWYSENVNAHLEQLQQLSGEQLLKVLNFRAGALPAVMCLQFMVHHSIHHRGQLSAYLRSMGEKVPSIYGESLDDAEARKKAAEAKSGVA